MSMGAQRRDDLFLGDIAKEAAAYLPPPALIHEPQGDLVFDELRSSVICHFVLMLEEHGDWRMKLGPSRA
jgi:hypothetical protein